MYQFLSYYYLTNICIHSYTISKIKIYYNEKKKKKRLAYILITKRIYYFCVLNYNNNKRLNLVILLNYLSNELLLFYYAKQVYYLTIWYICILFVYFILSVFQVCMDLLVLFTKLHNICTKIFSYH